MDILVNISNQRLKIATNLKAIVAGTQNFVRFVFNLTSEWDNLSTFAQFCQNGKAYNQYLDENNCVFLPSEIGVGTCTLMLYGSNNGITGTTNYITLTIDENILVSDANSTEISESLYNQLITRINALESEVNNMSPGSQGSSGSVTVTGAVAYDTVQSLSASQRTTAKNNIGVYVSADEPADAQDGDVWFDIDDIDNESFTGSNTDNNVMVENPRFELIETITIDDETITTIERSTTPDGKPYQFREVIVDYEVLEDITAEGTISFNAYVNNVYTAIAMACSQSQKKKARASHSAKVDKGMLISGHTYWAQYEWTGNERREQPIHYLVDTDYIDKIKLSREQGFKEMKIAIYGVRYSNGCTCNALGDIAALLDKINGEVV